MFTGIITDVGEIAELEKTGDLRARILTTYDTETVDIGASIACNGVCLTVITKGRENGRDWFDVEISAESVSKTNIASGRKAWDIGSRVNLERALKLGDELGGHIVCQATSTVLPTLQTSPPLATAQLSPSPYPQNSLPLSLKRDPSPWTAHP